MEKEDVKKVINENRARGDLMSHRQLMTQVFIPEKECIPSVQFEQVESQSLVEGRVMKVVELKEVNQSERMANYKVSDFYLENVIASGAIASMKESTFGSSFDSAVAAADNLPDLDPQPVTETSVS